MLKTTKRLKARERSNVIQFNKLSARPRNAARPFGVHHQEIVGGQLLAFPGYSRNEVRPMSWRNAASLAPLLCPTGRDANIASHLGDRVPAPEKLSEGSHVGSYIAGDGLSRQVVAIVPVTVLEAHRTMSPMGRARTPVQFNKAFAARLKAARIAAGYDTQKPFATALGIEVERYKKWESGRTPIQHEYVEAVCGLTGKDANYFYGIIPAREQIVKRTGT